MICFTLCCTNEHKFDSWFASSRAFEKMSLAHQLSCPVCGDENVVKSLMSPAISTTQSLSQPLSHPLSQPQSDVERAMAQMRKTIEESSDYVGLNFAHEARKMHLGDAPTRAIYGEAKLEEARALLEDGIPVAALPFMPRVKAN